MEVQGQQIFYSKDDIDMILDELCVRGTWSQNEAARNVKEALHKAKIWRLTVEREA